MDRLKFRVWCEKDREYIEDQCDECFIGYGGNVVCGAYYDDDFCGHMDYYEQSDIFVEQCTGLKDKNGKLIYEGDRIYISSDTGKQIKATIKWDVESATFYAEADGNLFGGCGYYGTWHNKDTEIIGNIHNQKEEK